MRLITLGCSLTHQIGWADYVSTCSKLPLINLAQSAGSNQIQQHRFKEFILTDSILHEDFVIWQITSTGRKHDRLKLTPTWRLKLAKELYVPDIIRNGPKFHHTITQKHVNLFDGKARVDLLCTTDYVDGPTDEEQLLEDLLFSLVMAKKHTPNLLVIFGWNEVIQHQHIDLFKTLLNKFGIAYLDDTIVDWCSKHNLPFAGSMHPTHKSYQAYGANVVLPKINNMIGTQFVSHEPWALELKD